MKIYVPADKVEAYQAIRTQALKDLKVDHSNAAYGIISNAVEQILNLDAKSDDQKFNVAAIWDVLKGGKLVFSSQPADGEIHLPSNLYEKIYFPATDSRKLHADYEAEKSKAVQNVEAFLYALKSSTREINRLLLESNFNEEKRKASTILSANRNIRFRENVKKAIVAIPMSIAFLGLLGCLLYLHLAMFNVVVMTQLGGKIMLCCLAGASAIALPMYVAAKFGCTILSNVDYEANIEQANNRLTELNKYNTETWKARIDSEIESNFPTFVAAENPAAPSM